MAYGLIELSTGNMVGFYKTEREALEEVVDSIDRYGRESVDTLGLGYSDPQAKTGYAIAEGEELAERALAVVRRSEITAAAAPHTQPHQNGRPSAAATLLGHEDQAR
jgi:hypothetical protein